MMRRAEGKTVHNLVKFIRVFYGKFLGLEWAKTFKVPKGNFKVKIVPDKRQFKVFYEALPNDYAGAYFLFLASSGLRVSELLSCQIDFEKRMLIPAGHEGRTKHAYISFFNVEAAEQYVKCGLPRINRRTLDKWFKKAQQKTGLHITPQTLREWFCSEMARLGVGDSYIDAFCGRVPRSVLARHYLDFSPERLKEVYDKACLKVLS